MSTPQNWRAGARGQMTFHASDPVKGGRLPDRQLAPQRCGADAAFAERAQRLGAGALGESLAVRTEDQTVVAVAGLGQTYQRLQQALHMRGFEQILAADHLGDPLAC